MAPLKLPRHNAGYSLVEILIGTAILGAVGLGIASFFNVGSKITDQSTIQSLIDSMHASGLHYARSPAQISKILGIEANAGLHACFSRKGTNCPGNYQKAWQTLENSAGDLNAKFSKNHGKCTSGPDCFVQRKADYRILCPASDYCNQVEVKIETSFNGPSTRGSFTKREQTIPIPGAVLAGRGKIDFSCAGSDRFLASVDYDHLRASCGTLTGGSASPSEQPLKIFPASSSSDWQALANKTCDNGFGQMGLFSGQPSCATTGGGGGGATPPGVCAPTDMQCQCDIPNNPLCTENCTDSLDHDLKWVGFQNGLCRPCAAPGADPNLGLVDSGHPTCHVAVYPASTYLANPLGTLNEVLANPVQGSQYHATFAASLNALPKPACPPGFELQSLGTVGGVCRDGNCGASVNNGLAIAKNVTRYKCVRTSCGLQPLPPSGCYYPSSYSHQYIYPSAHCGSTALNRINDGPEPIEAMLTGYARHTGDMTCRPGYTKVPVRTYGTYSQCNADGTRLHIYYVDVFNCTYTGVSSGLCAPAPGGSPLAIESFGACPAP